MYWGADAFDSFEKHANSASNFEVTSPVEYFLMWKVEFTAVIYWNDESTTELALFIVVELSRKLSLIMAVSTFPWFIMALKSWELHKESTIEVAVADGGTIELLLFTVVLYNIQPLNRAPYIMPYCRTMECPLS